MPMTSKLNNSFVKVEKEQGRRLDVLVNNACRIPAGGPSKLRGKFWEQDVAVWDNLHTVGLRSHYVASCYAMPATFDEEQGNIQVTTPPDCHE